MATVRVSVIVCPSVFSSTRLSVPVSFCLQPLCSPLSPPDGFFFCVSYSTPLVLSALISNTPHPRSCTFAFLSTLLFTFLPFISSCFLLAHVVTPIALFGSSILPIPFLSPAFFFASWVFLWENKDSALNTMTPRLLCSNFVPSVFVVLWSELLWAKTSALFFHTLSKV